MLLISLSVKRKKKPVWEKVIDRLDVLFSSAIFAMDLVQLLRSHIPSMSDGGTFSALVDRVEKQLNAILEQNNQELYEDQCVVSCIDLEGLDGCGKSTLLQELNQQLTAQGRESRLLSTPPSELLPFRPYFDKQDDLLRRAYYNLGNLMVSLELKDQQKPRSVAILDRYWPSTIAYRLARLDQGEQVDISWPSHLVQPSLIIYLYVDEVERRRRIAQRSIPVTLEEQELAAQEAFRRRLDLIYWHRIPSSRVHVIDGNRPTSIIASEILNLLQT